MSYDINAIDDIEANLDKYVPMDLMIGHLIDTIRRQEAELLRLRTIADRYHRYHCGQAECDSAETQTECLCSVCYEYRSMKTMDAIRVQSLVLPRPPQSR